ncbi:MAG: beta-lactamase family protein [Flavobacteriaceae bacterium]
MRKNILFFIGLLCSFSINSQTDNTKKLDSLLNTFESKNQGMGIVTILKKDQSVYFKSMGYSNIEKGKTADKNTKYRIGSISKTYTATIIMQMVDENKLTLNTYLSSYFPQIPNADKITIDDLLRHRSGLYNITNQEDLRTWITKKQSRKKMLARFAKHSVDFEPKEKTSYSNTNYILLSYIAEEIDNASFSSILKKRIIKPLQLKRTHFGKSINERKNEALPYYFEDDNWNSVTMKTHLSAPMGAGGIVASANDVALFYTSLFDGKLVSSTSLEKMTNSSTGMGLGMSSLDFKGLKVYGHDGGIDGFSSFALHIPKKNLSISITLNGFGSSMLPLVVSILEIYFENDPSLQSKSSFELTSSELDQYLGIYSSSTFPAKVTFTKKKNTLFAQATGQPLFKLTAEKKNVFKYDAMGITFTFGSKKGTLSIFFQGNTHQFKKQNNEAN